MDKSSRKKILHLMFFSVGLEKYEHFYWVFVLHVLVQLDAEPG